MDVRWTMQKCMKKLILKKAVRLFIGGNNNGKAKTCYVHSSGKVCGSTNNSRGINYLKSMPKDVDSRGNDKSNDGATKTRFD